MPEEHIGEIVEQKVKGPNGQEQTIRVWRCSPSQLAEAKAKGLPLNPPESCRRKPGPQPRKPAMPQAKPAPPKPDDK